MAIRQHGAGWQVDVTVQGQRAPRVTAPTMQQARAWEARIKANLSEGREPLEGVTPAAAKAYRAGLDTLGQLYEHTLRTVWRGTKNERTAEANGRQWVEALGHGMAVRALTTDAIARVCDGWAEHRNSAATINRKLAALGRMLSVAVEEEVIAKAPRLPKRKEYAGRIRYFSDDEEASILGFFAEDEPDFHDLLILALETGMRQGELLGLQVRDYTLATGLLHLWSTKSDSPRSIPLTPRAKTVVLRRALRKQPADLLFPETLNARRISYLMGRWKHFRGVTDAELVFHTTRHTCCARLVQSKVPLPTVQRWMGHHCIETTIRYSHLAPDAFDEALAALSGWHKGDERRAA